MTGETGYLLPYGCAHAPKAYKWDFGGCFYCVSWTNIKRLFISTSPCSTTIKYFKQSIL